MAKKAVKQLPPPWMQGAQKINDQDMLVVHMNNGELEGLDNLQGGPSIDSNTGIREYSALGPIIELPEIRDIFYRVANEVEEHGKVSPDMHKIYETARHHSLPYREAPDEKHNPLKALEKTGTDGDTKLAFIPLNLAYLLIELRHVPRINPHTGLLMFGLFDKVKKFFRNVVRIAGTVGGAVLGGPLGAGAGRALAGMVTGQRPGEAFRSGINHMGRAGLISGIGGAVSHFAPGLAGSLGSMSSNILGPGITGAAGNFFTGPSSTMGMIGQAGNALGFGGASAAGAAGAAGAIPSISASQVGMASALPAGQLAGQVAGHAAPAAAASGFGNLMSGLSSVAPLAIAGLGYMGSKHAHKQNMKMYDKHQADVERQRESMGLNKNWEPLEARKRTRNPNYREMRDYEREMGYYPEPEFLDEGARYATGGLVKSYSKGTLVKGPGKGQADLIKTSVPEGSYIIDASSTSAFGDGSSQAGGQVLKEFENQVKRRHPEKFVKKVEAVIKKSTKQVPVWLSNDEYKFDPVTVTLLGKGSNARGADVLKAAVIKLRKHKISKGDSLPPKAKNPSHYISQGRF